MKHILKSFLVALMMVMPFSVAKAGVAVDTVAVQGYDLVSYHQGEGVPLKGTGNHYAFQDGVTYLFFSKENKAAFKAEPEKYLPVYGGYCAFGVTKSKKFVGDPLAYKLVDGKLYLNLNKNVQSHWMEKRDTYISEANDIWPEIVDKHPSDL